MSKQKEEIIEKIINMIMDDPYSYGEQLSDILTKHFEGCSMEELNQWISE